MIRNAAKLAEAKATLRQRQIEFDATEALRKKRFRSETEAAAAQAAAAAGGGGGGAGGAAAASAAAADEADDEPDEDEEAKMMAAMGIPLAFDSTAGKEVNDPRCKVEGVRKKEQRKYRQYMNRRGGFNRPLEETGGSGF